MPSAAKIFTLYFSSSITIIVPESYVILQLYFTACPPSRSDISTRQHEKVKLSLLRFVTHVVWNYLNDNKSKPNSQLPCFVLITEPAVHCTWYHWIDLQRENAMFIFPLAASYWLDGSYRKLLHDNWWLIFVMNEPCPAMHLVVSTINYGLVIVLPATIISERAHLSSRCVKP